MKNSAQEQPVHLNIYDLCLWKRFWSIARPFWVSGQKWKAYAMLAALLAVPVLLQKSFALFFDLFGRSSTAMQTKNLPLFKEVILQIPFAIAVMALSTVLLTYFMNRLAYEWQLWLTTRFLEKYFDGRAFYHLGGNGEIDNPDQRICDSIGSCTGIAVGFVTIFYNSAVALIVHTGVLWNISPRLCLLLLLYAALGTAVASLFGKRQINLSFLSLQKGADFRYALLQIRNNVESIAFFRGEQRERALVEQRVRELIGVQRKLISWERNIEFFSTGHSGYNYFIPYLVLAPLFMSGGIPFGDIARAGSTFGLIYTALVIVIEQLKTFGQLATETARLSALDTALTEPRTPLSGPGETLIESREGARLALDNLTVRIPGSGHTLVRGATAEVSPGGGLLIAGGSGVGKSSLLRAIAGLWNSGAGLVIRPSLDDMFFLPQRPYLVLGSLREQLLYPRPDVTATDEELEHALKKVNLAGVAERFGGFDAVMDWGRLLSPGEQQRLAFARLLLAAPRYAVLDEATSALDVKNEARIYRYLKESGTTCISVGHRPALLDYHDTVLELLGGGRWRLLTAGEFRAALHAQQSDPGRIGENSRYAGATGNN